MNKIIIKGRLTQDPELKKTMSDVSVCSFSVAVDREYAKKGEPKQTDFFSVETWRHTAEFVSRYFTKGQEILLEGSMICDIYEKEGQKRRSWKLRADRAEFCGSRAASEGSVTFEAPEDDSDLPF